MKRNDLSLPSKPCRLTADLADKVYTSVGEVAFVLYAMAVLHVLQPMLLQSLDNGKMDTGAVKDLRMAKDFPLMATKHSTQAISRSMGFIVVLHGHLWLTQADLKDSNCAP